MTRDEAWNLADLSVAAWNAHDLDLIMTHYEDAVELTSPVAAQLFAPAFHPLAGLVENRSDIGTLLFLSLNIDV